MSVQHSIAKVVASALEMRGTLSTIGWQAPKNLGFNEWRQVGVAFAAMESGVQWWLGDWWLAYKPNWGDRAKMFEADDWDGPTYGICGNSAVVCNAFDISRRRENLSFAHHTEVAPLSSELADELLDWCEETIAETGQPRSTRELRNRKREVSRAAHVANLQYPEGRYGLIYCDPPWRYDFSLTDNRKIENQYPTMELEEICAIPVASRFAADDAMLFMWAVNPKLSPHAFAVIEAWGFEYLTNFVWVKDKIGMGYHARAQHELLLVARRGNVPPPAAADRVSSVIAGVRGEHSAKPDSVYDMIEAAYPTLPKIELFARNTRPGWAGWGNQLAVAAE